MGPAGSCHSGNGRNPQWFERSREGLRSPPCYDRRSLGGWEPLWKWVAQTPWRGSSSCKTCFCLQKIATKIQLTIQDSSIKPSKYSGIWAEWPRSDTIWLEKIEMYSAAEQQVRKPWVRGWFCGKHHGPFRLLKSYGENVQDPRISCERTFNCLGLSWLRLVGLGSWSQMTLCNV